MMATRMRIASYNVENMFARAKAMNLENWAQGKAALKAHEELNEIFNQTTYSTATKAKILKIMTEQGLARTDQGPWLEIRKIRGKLINRPRNGAPSITADGRASWVGWAELRTEAVRESATLNTARVIGAVDADILGVVEAEDRVTLQRFNEGVLHDVDARSYEHVMLIDGNDDRGIDVGLLTRYPILNIRSHVNDRASGGTPIFSRDCAEYEVALPDGSSLWVLLNHFKSKGYGSKAASDARRRQQARRVREIVDAHWAAGETQLIVLGDLNDVPDSESLAPLLRGGSHLRDISEHEAFDDGGRPGTHGNCTASSKIDYILITESLWDRVTGGGIERRGMWGGTNGTLWSHFPEIESPLDAASDHSAIWAELGL